MRTLRAVKTSYLSRFKRNLDAALDIRARRATLSWLYRFTLNDVDPDGNFVEVLFGIRSNDQIDLIPAEVEVARGDREVAAAVAVNALELFHRSFRE